MLSFQDFFNSKRTLVATFNGTLALTFRKYIIEQVIELLKLSHKHELLRSHSFVFDLEQQLRNVNF